jgi:hypothetical protein
MVLCYTLAFPFQLRRIAHEYHPTVDPYNEAGERRTAVEEEYNRLMNADQSPYNFLYNVLFFAGKLTPGLYSEVAGL